MKGMGEMWEPLTPALSPSDGERENSFWCRVTQGARSSLTLVGLTPLASRLGDPENKIPSEALDRPVRIQPR